MSTCDLTMKQAYLEKHLITLQVSNSNKILSRFHIIKIDLRSNKSWVDLSKNYERNGKIKLLVYLSHTKKCIHKHKISVLLDLHDEMKLCSLANVFHTLKKLSGLYKAQSCFISIIIWCKWFLSSSRRKSQYIIFLYIYIYIECASTLCRQSEIKSINI